MNNLMLFEGNEVEVFEYKGKILFNPKHVAKCLDIKNVNDAMTNFNEKQKIKLRNSDIANTDIRKLNNAGENFITESGVYKLIFKSRKESAERFQDWVTDEVLPTLRKTGTYSLSNNLPIEVNQMLNCINEQQNQIDQLIESTKEQQHQINEIKQLVGIRAKQTFNYSQLIKNHLGIDVINEDYRIIKEMFFVDRQISKWEDLSFEVAHVKRLKEICEQYKPLNQISFFDN